MVTWKEVYPSLWEFSFTPQLCSHVIWIDIDPLLPFPVSFQLYCRQCYSWLILVNWDPGWGKRIDVEKEVRFPSSLQQRCSSVNIPVPSLEWMFPNLGYWIIYPSLFFLRLLPGEENGRWFGTNVLTWWYAKSAVKGRLTNFTIQQAGSQYSWKREKRCSILYGNRNKTDRERKLGKRLKVGAHNWMSR